MKVKRQIKKVSSLEAPLSLERDYQKKLRSIVYRTRDIIRTEIVQNLPTIMDEVNRVRPKNDSYEINLDDDIGRKVGELFSITRARLEGDLSESELSYMTSLEAQNISEWQKKRITMVIKQGLGFDLVYGEPWLAETLQMFSIGNVNLIKSNNFKFLDDVQETVFNGMRAGYRHEVIAKQILGIDKDELGKVTKFKSAKTRANIIGRDQVNKLNGDLNRLRQSSAGFTHYFWRDVGDTRVRRQHEIYGMAGANRYSWAKGAGVFGIHPGQEILCRCWAEPDFSVILEN